MTVSLNGYSCGNARAATRSDGSTLGSRQYRATQEFPPRAAEWQRLRLLSFSVSTLSELYIENRNLGEFFLYIFVGVACHWWALHVEFNSDLREHQEACPWAIIAQPFGQYCIVQFAKA
jgi:hypothetical protein